MDRLRILLYVPGMPITGEVMERQSLGGSESSGAYLARELVRRGHEVGVFTDIQHPAEWCGVQLLPIGQPTEHYPMGEQFEQRALTIRHDVLVIQRATNGPTKQFNNKLQYFWAHDLGRERSAVQLHAHDWRYTGFFTVSDWHRNQFHESMGIPLDKIHVLHNAPDADLFQVEPNYDRKWRAKNIVYISRPERGLENIVKSGGVAELLETAVPEATIFLAHYDNTTPAMQGLYQSLWSAAAARKNVRMLGSLSKRGIAELMTDSFVWLYPVIPSRQFEETSCIAAMEASFGGTVPVVSRNGAVPETLGVPSALRASLIDYASDESTDIAGFVSEITRLANDHAAWQDKAERSREYAKQTYLWEDTAVAFEDTVSQALSSGSRGSRLIKHLFYQADAQVALDNYIEPDILVPYIAKELNRYPQLTGDTAYSSFYVQQAEKIAHENPYDAWSNLRPENLPVRYRHMHQMIDQVARRGDGGRVLEMGCGRGIALLFFAKMYPRLMFYGCDIAEQFIEQATAEAVKQNITNVSFEHGSSVRSGVDLLVCMEMLEHTAEPPEQWLNEFEHHITPGGWILLSFPASQPDWKPPVPETREHVRFIEPADLHEILNGRQYNEEYYIEGPNTPAGEPTVGVCVSWRVTPGLGLFKPRNLSRKLRTQAPRQLLTVGMIVRSDSTTIGRTLDSVKEIADEIIVRIDNSKIGKNHAKIHDIVREYGATVLYGSSPREIGFSAARNETIDAAMIGDWFLWIDDDEILLTPLKLQSYLRANMYDGYAIHQHHLSAEPPGLLKTDLPVRLFRLNRGFRFFGLVHEHPEIGEINGGSGATSLVPAQDCAIMHVGYENEEVRLERFHRNWPLMERDHVENPQRRLGQLLYLRDLAHVVRFKSIQRGNPGFIDEEISSLCDLGVRAWNNLVAGGDARLATDGLVYYSELVAHSTQGNGFIMEFSLHSQYGGLGDPCDGQGGIMRGMFSTELDAERFVRLLFEDKFARFRKRYY